MAREVQLVWCQFCWIWLFLSILIWCQHCKAILPEQECPEECDCYYSRINWVTDCSESGLDSIPAYTDGLSSNVYLLNLNNNNLREIDRFPDDIKLRSLTMAFNQLTAVTRDYFYALGYLLDIDLSNNNIKYIDADAFIESPGLITVQLQNNPLERIEGPFLISKSLLNLDLSNCQLNYLNEFFFSDTPALNYLDLSDNPLDELKSGIFSRIISLHVLKLNKCKLTKISEYAFDKLEDLKTLELADNLLIGPLDWTKIFTPIIRLEYLDLRRSGISTLPNDLFLNNIWLRSLILAENHLNDFDLSTVLSKNLKNLDLIDLSACNLNGPLSKNSFSNSSNLRTLLLSDNKISSNDLVSVLSPLKNLRKLCLKNCNLNQLPANTFDKFSKLEELDISLNPLNNVFTELLNPLENLIFLNLSYCNLGNVSKNTFLKMTSLKTLILSGNSLKILELGLFQSLKHLKRLELNNCDLSSLNETVFKDSYTYPDLEELYLSNNPLIIPKIGSFLPKQLSDLKILDLSYCNITYIPKNALDSFGTITQLYLQGNKLSYNNEKSLEFLKNLPYLEKLDISNNQFKIITPQIFKFNPELKFLKLENNPWQCGCHIADMWEWAYIVKKDLSVLVGSVLAQNELPMVNSKRSKALLCENVIKKPSKGKQFNTEILLLNRTWLRFVRESICDSSRRLIPTKLITTLTTKIN